MKSLTAQALPFHRHAALLIGRVALAMLPLPALPDGEMAAA
jgi:hypothetical protein